MNTINSAVNPTLSFDNYVVGTQNQLAHAAALQVAESSGKTFNPLFIYGGVGLGKTHLLHAIGNEFMLRNPQGRICYSHAMSYVAEVVNAFENKQFAEFKTFYSSLDLLLIDDVQFISDKLGTQQEFFYTLNSLTCNNKQVVISCETYPTEIDGMSERLTSIFCGGLTVEVVPPDMETEVSIILKKTDSDVNPFGEEVARFIAKNVRIEFSQDMRKLEGIINRIRAYARFHNRTVTIDLVIEALSNPVLIDNYELSSN